ncbi:MAG: hypothetical protein QOG43_130 [Actinomycetota bacterium]|nr:hypothetical protein [Actinomycetota bacterium]
MNDLTGATATSHALRPHPIDSMISPSLRARLAGLDPLLNLDRVASLVAKRPRTRAQSDSATSAPPADMRVLVCGSRSWADQGKVEEVLERVTAGVAKVTLVQGDARGADRMAADVARRRGWAVESHPANWRSEGRSAGMARNQRMLLNGRPSFVVAFIDERDRPSPGTRDMVRRARQAGVKGLIVRAEA